MEAAVISYTLVDDEHVAWLCGGHGPDVLWVPSLFAGDVDLRASTDPANGWFRQLQQSCRTITFDRRGSGASDQPWRELTFDDWLADAVAVLDAASSDSCTVVAMGDGSAVAMALAVEHRSRVRSLVLLNPVPRYAWAPDWALGRTEEQGRAVRENLLAGWGRDDVPVEEADSVAEAMLVRRAERAAASPAAVLRDIAMLRAVDVRELVPLIEVPVTIVHRPDGDRFSQHTAWVAEQLPQANVLEVEGFSRILQKIAPVLLDTIRRCARGDHGDDRVNRSIAAVVFADIVDSTGLATSFGDDEWRRRLDDHDDYIAALVAANAGRVVNTAGDGALALFPGPTQALSAAAALAEPHPAMFPLRVGIHVGEVEHRGDDVAGIAVHVGARVGALAEGGEVLVSRTVRDLVAGSDFAFEARGRHHLKGLDEDWDIFAFLR